MVTQIDIPLLINRLLPSFMRRPRMMAALAALCRPVVTLQTTFLLYRATKLRELTYNSQTMVLERILREVFGSAGIYIENVSSSFNRSYIFQLSENERPYYIRQLSEEKNGAYIYRLQEYAAAYDFIVFVPVALVFDPARMNAVVNSYKIAGLRHTIQTY